MTLLRLKASISRSIAKAFILTPALALVLAIGGCGDEIEFQVEPMDTAPKTDTAKTEKAADSEAGPEIERDYIYTSIGKRDPFRSIFDEVGGEAALSQEETILSPLQNYDINSFTVNAIIWGISSPTALVTAPDGASYIVKTGTLMGRNWGRVVKIKSDSIVVLEQRPLPNGTKVSNLIELKLPVVVIKPKESEVELPEDDEAGEPTKKEIIQEYGDRP